MTSVTSEYSGTRIYVGLKLVPFAWESICASSLVLLYYLLGSVALSFGGEVTES